MLFNSLNYLIFLPIVILINFLLPQRIRYIWLLIASYYFYMCWNAKYALLILFSTCVTYLSGIIIEYIKKTGNAVRRKKVCVVVCFAANLFVLFFFKYFDFIFINLNIVLNEFGLYLKQPDFDILLPVGISFYTFQALGYIIDVYRDDIYAEKNFLKYALFVSFFPQLVAGPIERSKNLLKQINMPTYFNVQNVRYGLFTMAYGLFLKIVIADKIAIIIDPILSDYTNKNGMQILLCIILFSFQIYCDFHGYTQIAIGTAKIFGYSLQENFKAPYLAGNIKEFWRNWHISLTSWFTDYLYIPLGGNRKGKIRKYVNTMIVFLCSGLWHGASWGYVTWGGINGLYLVIYDLSKNIREKLKLYFHIDQSGGWKIVSRLGTFALVDYTWLYFRAKGLKTAYYMQRLIIRDFYFPYLFSDDLFQIFGNYSTVIGLIIALWIVLIIDYCQYKNIDWKQKVLNQQVIFRWFIYVAMLFLIFVYGGYGIGNEQTQFIYFQF